MLGHGVIGLIAFPLIAWLFAERRQAPNWRILAGGFLLQFVLALLLLKVSLARRLFAALNDLVLQLDAALQAGTGFVFGYLGGGTMPFEVTVPGGEFILAFRALPLVILMSALSALLYHWRVLPLVVRAFSWLLRKVMAIGGPLGLGSAANIFVGMVEAPLLIRPYISALSRSDLFALMTCGMATIAGTVMILYAGFIAPVVPDAMGHIVTASLLSAPASLMIARLMVPAEGQSIVEAVPVEDQRIHSSMDAITQGTVDGLKLFLNIVALLMVFVALVYIVNELLSLLPVVGGQPLTLQRMLGWAMAPLVWLAGVAWDDAVVAGGLMGVKTILNELLAYLQMAALPEAALSDRSRLIMTYALCGFANFGSLGIMIGGLATIAPDRRSEVASLGMRSIAGGTLATLMTAAVVSVLI